MTVDAIKNWFCESYLNGLIAREVWIGKDHFEAICWEISIPDDAFIWEHGIELSPGRDDIKMSFFTVKPTKLARLLKMNERREMEKV